MPYIKRSIKKKRIKYNKYQHNKNHTRYYNAYRDIRQEYIRRHPLDELLFIEGIIKPMEECHHLIEISSTKDEDERMFLATCIDNLISLTKQNHIKVHNYPERLTDRQREYLNAKISNMNKILYEYRCIRD